MLISILVIALFIFIIYLLIDLVRNNPNAFFDKWFKKSMWMWLPFYALWRLVREIFFDKR